jgi:hypothetical protein
MEMRSSHHGIARWWLSLSVAWLALVLTAWSEVPAKLLANAHQIVFCEGPNLEIQDRIAYKPTKKVVAEGAACHELLGKLANGKDDGTPGVGLGYFAHLAVLDRAGKPLMLLSVYTQSGITSIERASRFKGHATHRVGKDNLAIKTSPEFTRHLYDYLKKNDPASIASMQKFYAKIGTSLEEMLFEDGVNKLIERSRKQPNGEKPEGDTPK